eukprot:COSAG01_NODE_47992_length_385_cov_0.713287_2_plen_40_part_01
MNTRFWPDFLGVELGPELLARVQEHSGFSSMQKLNGRSAP